MKAYSTSVKIFVESVEKQWIDMVRPMPSSFDANELTASAPAGPQLHVDALRPGNVADSATSFAA
jgi:hypothetical protein